MPVIKPPSDRHTVQDDHSALRISIPSRKSISYLILIGFWLAGWLVGEIFGGMMVAGLLNLLPGTPAISGVNAPILTGYGLFAIAWLVLWTVGGGFALYTFLWQLAGREIVTISDEGIAIQRAVFRFGRKKMYLAEHIQGLRVAPSTMTPGMFGWNRMGYLWGMTGGLLAFDYGAQTFRFGAGVEEAEARRILEKITARFPQYGW